MRASNGAAQDLEGDVAADYGIVRLPHRAHRAFPDELVQLELADVAVLIRTGHTAPFGRTDQCAHYRPTGQRVRVSSARGPLVNALQHGARRLVYGDVSAGHDALGELDETVPG